VAGVEKPTDLGSRGVTAAHLKGSKLWLEGPEWLRKGEEYWPKDFVAEESSDIDSERRNTPALVAITSKDMEKGLRAVMDLERYGSLHKLLRVTAYVLIFIKKLKSKRKGKDLECGGESVEEIENAERLWIKDARISLQQKQDFQKTGKQLGIESVEGMLICRGRLRNSGLDFSAKYHLIFPKNHPFTDLIMADCHLRIHHHKLMCTLAELRAPRGRQLVKKVVNRCQRCRWMDRR